MVHAVGFVMKEAVNEVGSFIQWVLWLIKGLVGHLLIDLMHISNKYVKFCSRREIGILPNLFLHAWLIWHK